MFSRGKLTNKKIITSHANLKTWAQGESLSCLKHFFRGNGRWEINKVLKILYRLLYGVPWKKTHRFQQPRRRGKVSSRTYPQSSAESPCHISILSVVRGGMEQHIVLRVLGHWLCLNSHLNLPTITALLLYISESLAVLNRAEFYAIDCYWCDYTTSELFNVVANLCMEEIEESAINSSSVPPKKMETLCRWQLLHHQKRQSASFPWHIKSECL